MLLSQNKTASASSYEAGKSPANGNDGDMSTRWTAVDASYPHWWKVDLGAEYNLTKIDIFWLSSSTLKEYAGKVD